MTRQDPKITGMYLNQKEIKIVEARNMQIEEKMKNNKLNISCVLSVNKKINKFSNEQEDNHLKKFKWQMHLNLKKFH